MFDIQIKKADGYGFKLNKLFRANGKVSVYCFHIANYLIMVIT